MSFDQFRTSTEGKQPASPEFEASLRKEGEQGGGATPPDATSTGEEPAKPPATPDGVVTPQKTEGEPGSGQEDGKDSARSKEEKPQQLRGLEAEERALEDKINQTRIRIQEKRAARRAILESAREEGLFAREPVRRATTAPVAPAAPTEGEEGQPAPGTFTKDEAEKMLFERDSNFQLQLFLGEHPEYTPEKDPYNERWDALQVNLKKYREPRDAAEMRQVLQWAHRDVSASSAPPPSAPRADADAARKAALAQAGQGGSGSPASTPGSSSTINVDPDKIAYLERGGFSREEATRIVKRAAAR